MKIIKILLAACLVVLNFSFETATGQEKCPDYMFVFARGSGQKINDKDFLEYKHQINAKIRNTPNLSYEFYELGTKKVAGFQYPAVKVSAANNGNVFRLGKNTFDKSVSIGVSELVQLVKIKGRQCPSTRFVLAGYSQGAMVVKKALTKIKAEKVAYVATFGDPNLYLPEGKGKNPPACRGEKLSRYRQFAPNCKTYQGVLGGIKPYESKGYEGKIGLWCNQKDIVCGRFIDVLKPLKDHTSYTTQKRYQHAANVIAGRLGANQAHKSLPKPQEMRQNVAFIIDSTGSMRHHIEKYKKEARALAKKVIESSGNIALIEYKDLGFNKDSTVLHCDFSCTIEEFSAKLDSIEVSGGGNDIIESALSASMFALDNLEWQYGANKSIVLLTDAGFHNPDHDGTTLRDVINRSLEIDPVNFYLIADYPTFRQYEGLLNATAGKFFSIYSDEQLEIATNYIMERPLVHLPVEKYIGKVGETITFDASQSLHSANIIRYEWDLDLDGEFEVKNFNPVMRKKYDTAASGFMQVKLVDYNGKESTMSAKVEISELNNLEPEIELLHKTELERSIKVEFAAKNAEVIAVLIDGDFVSFTRQNEIELQIEKDSGVHILSLIPISKEGEKGEALIVETGKAKEGQMEQKSAQANYVKYMHKIPVPNTGGESESGDIYKLKTYKAPKVPNTGVVNH